MSPPSVTATCYTVTATTDGDLEGTGLRDLDGGRDVLNPFTAGDERGPFVDQAIEDTSSQVVTAITGTKDGGHGTRALMGRAQLPR
jgi:hypothetical protein